MKNDIKIDFVIPWVDGADPKWKKEKEKYIEKKINESNSDIRFRDWGLLKYWFRGIEKYAPWVNKVYFITCGQKPSWINEKDERLVFVNHEDYIPNELLPTFNVNVIEDNIYRIEGLEEHFVYFNDDMYIINPMKKDDFFKNGKPRDSFSFNAVSSKKDNNMIEHMILNDGAIIEKYFSKKEVIKNNFFKIYNLKYGFVNNLKSILLYSWKGFTGIENPHIPCPYLKSVMKNIWELEYEELRSGSLSKFRSKNDINIWLFRYWNLYSGNFIPRTTKRNFFYDLKNKNEKLDDILFNKKMQMICINDSNLDIEYEKVMMDLIKKFEKKFPEKSKFEK